MTGHHPVEKLSAAIDGQLDHDARDKVFGHLVGCDSCRATVDAERRLKSQLTQLSCPEPPMDLVQRLLGVPAFGTEPREEIRPVPAVTLSPAKPIMTAGRGAERTRPAGAGPARGGSRRRTVMVSAASSAAAVASLLAAGFAVGEPTQQPPVLQPPVNSFSEDHASTTSNYPFGDSASLLPALNGGFYQPVLTGATDFTPVGTTGR